MGVPPRVTLTIEVIALVERAKSAEKGSGTSAVANLGELHVREQAGTPPQPGEEEDGHHSGEQEAPPQPVAADALAVHEPGDHQRGVGGEGGGDHGSAGEPPVHVAPGDEVVVHGLAGAAAEVESEREGDAEIGDDGGPVEEGEGHSFLVFGFR
jgi:hypothetical protein